MDWKDEILQEPKISLRDEISPMRDPVPVGRLGIPYYRDCDMVFVKKVKRGDPPDNAIHYYNDIQGYAISRCIIEQLQIHDVGRIFTYEEDTGLVLEHTMETYLDGEEIDNPRKGDDKQLAVSEHDAEYRWENLGEDLFTNDSFWSQN